MTEVTRVPIQPIEKGSLTKLWLGVVVAVLLGAGIAWSTLPKSVEVTELVAGTGASPSVEDVVFVKFVGKLPDGTEFDRSQDIPAPVEGIFPELFIPSEKAYGDAPPPGSAITPGADLTFEIELVDFMTAADFERRLSILQQMMQQQGVGPGMEAPPQP